MAALTAGTSPTAVDLRRQYALALRDWCKGGGEAALLRAWQVGRQALADGIGVLELAAIHQEALQWALGETASGEDALRAARRAGEFLAEALSPYEMAVRAFQQSTHALRTVARELEQELLEQKRTEELKNEFISIVSHELRTPLTSIHGSLGLINAGLGGELSRPAKQLLEVAYRNSQRVVRLVNDILDLQKIESGTLAFQLQPLEVSAVLEQAIEANQSYGAQFGVTFALRDAPRGARVRADSDRLMQVMANLMSNAAKFSPPGEMVVLWAARLDGAIRVAVTDRGRGVPEEFHARIFEKFVQAEASSTREKGGTGLGLSISKAIVEKMGGRIGLESAAGSTTFWFDLPEAVEDAAPGPREPA